MSVSGDPVHHLLRRVLRVRNDGRFIRRLILADDELRYVALVDSGTGTSASPATHDTALHVLWARDEPDAAIEVADHGRLAVAPGDTLTVAAGTSWTYAAGMIVCEIAGKSDSAAPGRLVGPTHGLESFHGYNRRTLCAIAPGFSLERWKITQPLTLAANATIVNLVNPLALIWSGGTDLLGRGELHIVPAATGPITLLPDGLGYALVIRPTTQTCEYAPEALTHITL